MMILCEKCGRNDCWSSQRWDPGQVILECMNCNARKLVTDSAYTAYMRDVVNTSIAQVVGELVQKGHTETSCQSAEGLCDGLVAQRTRIEQLENRMLMWESLSAAQKHEISESLRSELSALDVTANAGSVYRRFGQRFGSLYGVNHPLRLHFELSMKHFNQCEAMLENWRVRKREDMRRVLTELTIEMERAPDYSQEERRGLHGRMRNFVKKEKQFLGEAEEQRLAEYVDQLAGMITWRWWEVLSR